MRLDFGIGGGLVLGGDGDSAEGFGVVSGCETEKIYLFMSCALKLVFFHFSPREGKSTSAPTPNLPFIICKEYSTYFLFL